MHLITILSALKTHNNSPCSVLLSTIKEQLKVGTSLLIGQNNEVTQNIAKNIAKPQ